MSHISPPNYIDVSQLRVGIFVHLDLGWMDHSFAFSNFKVKDEEQIAKIKKIGIKQLRYDPNRSDCEPLPPSPAAGLNNASENISAVPGLADLDDTEASIRQQEQEEQARQQKYLERLHLLHRAFDDNEKHFIESANATRSALKHFIQQPKQSIAQAEIVVDGMVECALNESEIAINAINGNRSSDNDYIHSLNVTVLAMMMARSMDMTEEDARTLGMAAIFHDIGKLEIPDKILMKTEALTKSEQSYYEQHSALGARLAKKSGLSDHVAKIILQHHENADGSGYPSHLLAAQTDPLARLVAVLSSYDNLCNPKNPLLAKTPYEALAYMFANQRSKFDEDLLKRLIKSLGIYPPGSIVQLSNGIHGVVISVNPNKPLRPFVMLHDSMVDRNIPLILDLREEPGITISICLKPNQLPQEALEYLNPRKRVSYAISTDFAKTNTPK